MSILNTTVGAIFAASTKTSSANGTALNITDYEGPAMVILSSGAATAGSSPTLDVKIQDSADGSTGWNDVTGATFAQVTTSASLEAIPLDTNLCKQYVRGVATIGGTSTPTFAFSVVFAGKKKYL